MNKPHIHADLIKKWADGVEIEVKDRYGVWIALSQQGIMWFEKTEYRVKPEVTTSLTDEQLAYVYYTKCPHPNLGGTSQWFKDALKAVADAAIKQYIKDSANKA